MSTTDETVGALPDLGAETTLAPLVFGSPSIGEEEIQEVVDTLRSGWIGTGPKTARFEEAFSDYVGTAHAIGTNSGTAALHLALSALGVTRGDEVITTPLTFVATANVIEHVGARTVFADVSLADGNLDPAKVETMLSPKTKAIIPVHYAGAAAPIAAFAAVAPSVNIVTDAAHAVETQLRDGSSSAGGGARCTAYSFYVTKNLVTGEGGMLVTNDDDLAETVRRQSLHGLDSDAWKRYSSGKFGEYDLTVPGFKYNMTDIQASLGIHQLARLELNLERRARLWKRYVESFDSAAQPAITLPPIARHPNSLGRHARHLFTIWLDWNALGLTRSEFVNRMAQRGVGTGWHFKAVHLHTYYARRYGLGPGSFPHAEWIADRTISLPLSPKLRLSDVDRVVATVLDVVSERS